MRRLILLLLLCCAAIMGRGANVTSDPSGLVFGSVTIEGSLRASMTQLLHVTVTNPTDKDYQDYWQVYDVATATFRNGVLEGKAISVPANTTCEVTLEFFLMEAGDYQFQVFPGSSTYSAQLFSFTVSIAPYSNPRVTGSVQLDMLQQTADGNFLYGDLSNYRISGRATLTNHEDFPIIGSFWDGAIAGLTVKVSPWADQGIPLFSSREVAHAVQPGETVTCDFSFDYSYPLGADEVCKVSLWAYESEVSSVAFTAKQCTNTYWTADGQAHQLPQDGMTLKVPAEALAVDLRGNYGINGIFTIDASAVNPNCLFYLNYMDYVPRGLDNSRLVIRDYERRDFVLNEDFDYYCPMPFTVKSALFVYTPESVPNDGYRSGTLVLPFDAQRAWLTAVNGAPGVDVGFNSPELTVSRYQGNDGNLLMFEPVGEDRLNAYEPYLVSRVLPSPIAFYAENVTIPATRPAVVKGAEIDFVGSTLAQATPEGFYRWNSFDRHFCQFVTDDLEKPFRALMVATQPFEEVIKYEGSDVPSSVVQVLYVGGEQATAVGNAKRNAAAPQTIYTLSGQCVGEVGKSSLNPGLYIIGGRKTVIK